MKFLMYALILLLLLGIAFAAYVRLASVDPTLWHLDPERAGDPGRRGDRRDLSSSLSAQEALSALDKIILASPRSRVIAGDPASGMVTYEIRSKLMRYPDYATVKAVETDNGSRLSILSRARFGQSDLGVNAARLDGWLEQFQPVGQ